MPQHRPPHRRDAPRQDFRRVRRGRHQGADHGRLRRSRGRLSPGISELSIMTGQRHRSETMSTLSAGSDGFNLVQAAARGPGLLRPDRHHRRLLDPVALLLHVGNFLTMASHVAIFGILADRHAAGHPQRRHRPFGRLDAWACRRRRRLPDAGRDARHAAASSSIRRSGSSWCSTCVLGAFVGAGQRRADRLLQGAGLRRDARRASMSRAASRC